MRIIQHSAVTVLNKKRNSPVTPPFFFTKTTEFNSKNSPATLFFHKRKLGFSHQSKLCQQRQLCAQGLHVPWRSEKNCDAASGFIWIHPGNNI